MKRMMLALMLAFTISSANSQTAFEIKGDLYLDEIESIYYTASHFGQVSYTNLLSYADALIRDANFSSQWPSYQSGQIALRTTPLSCTVGLLANYYDCVSYYGWQQIPIPPSGTPGLNECQRNLVNAINECLGLPMI